MMECRETEFVSFDVGNKSRTSISKHFAIFSNVTNCGLPLRVLDKLSEAIPILFAKSFNVIPLLLHNFLTVVLKLTFISIIFWCKVSKLIPNINQKYMI